jgi:hypothetical protein
MGVFVFVAILLGFGFVYWLRTVGRAIGQAMSSVSMASHRSLEGAPVLINGVRVGDVTGLRLNPAEPQQLLVDVTIDASTPVRVDTIVGLSFQGLAGVPAISMVGGTEAAGAPTGPLVATPKRPGRDARPRPASSGSIASLPRTRRIWHCNRQSPVLRALSGNAERFDKMLPASKDGRSSEGGAGERRQAGTEFPGLAAPPVALVVDTPTA